MLIARIDSASTGNVNYLGYTRHTSGCLGVALINPPVPSKQERGVSQTSEPHRSYSSAFSTLTRTTSPGFTLVAPFK